MSTKVLHEVRDAVHNFVEFTNAEKKIIATPHFQRLRNVRQLSMTHYVYPGAVHTRFEHSIGTMELAGRVFDVLFDKRNRHSDSVEPFRSQIENDELIPYWRRHLRMAALLHDIGHPPFSHATESLFPDGENHETMTKKIILDSELSLVLQSGCEMTYDLNLVAKLAVGPKHFSSVPFEPWEQILNEIVVSDAFGVDRMDYLMRDAHHCGVVAGNFDHHRLIQTLRILKPPEVDENSSALSIGIEHGGIHPTEALLVARFFMYMQVYLHRVSTAYNIHCERFAAAYLRGHGNGSWDADPEKFIRLTDNELLCEISKAALDSTAMGHLDAKRIQDRNHFQIAYEFRPDEAYIIATGQVRSELEARLGESFSPDDYHISVSKSTSGRGSPALKDDFPVWNRKVEPNTIEYGKTFSRILDQLRGPSQEFVIADRDRKGEIHAIVDEFMAAKRTHGTGIHQ